LDALNDFAGAQYERGANQPGDSAKVEALSLIDGLK
jgi:hypothetical protein